MKKKMVYIAVALVVVLVIAAAAGKKKSKPEEAAKPDEGISVQTQTVKAQEVESFIDATGNLTAKNRAEVRSEVSSVIREVHVRDWVKVNKGDILAKIDSEEVAAAAAKAKAAAETAKAAYLEAQTYQNRAEREYERMQNLSRSGLATRQQMDDAETDRAAAKAKVASALAQVRAAEEDFRQASVRLGKTVITAPISGTLAARNANVGDMPGGDNSPALFIIVDDSIFDLNVSIPTVDIAGVGVGSRVEFTVDAFPSKVFDAKVAHVNPQVDSADRSVKVNIEVKNEENLLKSGFFVKAKIYTGNKIQAILLPQSAVFGTNTAERKAKIYVVENGTAKLKEVFTGSTYNGLIEITDGLKDGEQVVIRGGFTIKDGDKVSVGK